MKNFLWISGTILFGFLVGLAGFLILRGAVQ